MRFEPPGFISYGVSTCSYVTTGGVTAVYAYGRTEFLFSVFYRLRPVYKNYDGQERMQSHACSNQPGNVSHNEADNIQVL